MILSLQSGYSPPGGPVSELYGSIGGGNGGGHPQSHYGVLPWNGSQLQQQIS